MHPPLVTIRRVRSHWRPDRRPSDGRFSMQEECKPPPPPTPPTPCHAHCDKLARNACNLLWPRCYLFCRHGDCEHVLPVWRILIFARRGTRSEEPEGGHGVRREVRHAPWTGGALRVEGPQALGSTRGSGLVRCGYVLVSHLKCQCQYTLFWFVLCAYRVHPAT